VAVALLTERPACQSPRAERAATVCFDRARDVRGATVPCRVIRYLLYVHRVARGSAVARVKTVAAQVRRRWFDAAQMGSFDLCRSR